MLYQLGCHSHMRQKNDDGTSHGYFRFSSLPPSSLTFFSFFFLFLRRLLFVLVSIPLLFTQNTQRSCSYCAEG
ncbi:hypothetical protein CI102_1984 [Trichoderma harzianum]|nr:hypothetical protein CI102_1984 [Trichoderma harzianum]